MIFFLVSSKYFLKSFRGVVFITSMKKAGCIENSILETTIEHFFFFEGYIIISHAIGQGTLKKKKKTQKNSTSQLLKTKIQRKKGGKFFKH